MSDTPDPKAQKTVLNAQLKAWARVGARWERASAFMGLAQFALFIGFAYGAAQAVAGLAAGEPVWRWLALAAGFALLRAGAQAAETRFGIEAAAKVKAHVRRQAAAGLARLGPAAVERRASGESATALIDSVEKMEGYYGRYRALMIVSTFAPLIIAAGAFTASWVAGALFLVTAPFLIIFMAVVGAGAAAASRDQMTVLQRLAGRFNDRLQALETLNAFDGAEREAQGLARAAEDFRKRTMKVLALAFLSSGILEFFAALAVAATAVYVGFSLLGEMPFPTGETVTLAEGVFVLILAPEFYLPLRRLSAAYHDKADASAGAQAIAPLMETPKAAEGAAAPIRLRAAPAIGFEYVGCVYPDGRRGLEALSFAAPAGAITILWGPSGAGKSTALKLLLGFAPLTEGRILIDGEALGGSLAGQAAWIGQSARLFHGTLAENIALFDERMDRARLQAAAEAAGVMDFASALPAGLDAPMGERGYGLSGGQAQRVALARALAAEAKLLLLDEPTAHLDGEAAGRFLEALKRIASGRTVLIATHDPIVRAIGDHTIALADRERRAA